MFGGDSDPPDGLPPGTPPTYKFEGPWFTTQLLLSCGIGFTSFFVFSYARTRWPLIFAPRTKLKGFSPHEAHAHQAFFGWILPTIRTSEFTVLQIVGLDAAVLLGFFKMSFYLFSICSFFAITILMPVNWKNNVGIGPEEGDDGDWPSLSPPRSPIPSTTFTLTSTSSSPHHESNIFYPALSQPSSVYPPLGGIPGRDWYDLISDANSYLTLHLLFTYLFTFLALRAIYRNSRRFIRSRQLFSLELVHSIPARTVIITNLPPHLRSERALANYFENMNLSVESVSVCREISSLKRLLDNRTKALLDLEKVWCQYLGNPSTVERADAMEAGLLSESVEFENQSMQPRTYVVPHRPRPTMRPGWFKPKVDAIEYLENKFKEADRAVREKRMKRFKATEAAFVTFEKMSSAQIAIQVAHANAPNTCTTRPAPEPRDIVWANMGPSTANIRTRDVIVIGLMALLLFTWIFPITALASLLSYKEIKKTMPWLGQLIDSNDKVRAIVQNSLPSVAMITLNALLPFMLEFLTYMQGYRARSWIEFSLLKKYFLFLLINVVFIFLLASTYWQLVRDLANSPAKIPEKLATALQAGRARHFFLSYVILQGLGIMPLQLLNLGVIVPRAIYRMFITRTPRDYAELNAPPMINYGVVYPQAILMFVITMLYSVQQPLIVIFGAVYFGVAYVVYKYKLLFVFYKPYESQGQAWPITFVRLIWGVLIFQIFMSGIFVLRKSFVLSTLLAPLIIATLLWTWYVHTSLTPLSRHVSLSSVFEVERGEETADRVKLRAGHPVTWSQSNLSRRRYAQNDDTLYVAPEDERTDYSQPPMANWYNGVLNTGKRRYGHPALNGVLPQPWLPLKKGQTLVNSDHGSMNGRQDVNDRDQAVVLTMRKPFHKSSRKMLQQQQQQHPIRPTQTRAYTTGGQRPSTSPSSSPTIPLALSTARAPDMAGSVDSSTNAWSDHHQQARHNSTLSHRLSFDVASGVIMLPDDGAWLHTDEEVDSEEEHYGDMADSQMMESSQVSDADHLLSGRREESTEIGNGLGTSSTSTIGLMRTSSGGANASLASPNRTSRYGTYFHHPERRNLKQTIPGEFPQM